MVRHVERVLEVGVVESGVVVGGASGPAVSGVLEASGIDDSGVIQGDAIEDSGEVDMEGVFHGGHVESALFRFRPQWTWPWVDIPAARVAIAGESLGLENSVAGAYGEIGGFELCESAGDETNLLHLTGC